MLPTPGGQGRYRRLAQHDEPNSWPADLYGARTLVVRITTVFRQATQRYSGHQRHLKWVGLFSLITALAFVWVSSTTDVYTIFADKGRVHVGNTQTHQTRQRHPWTRVIAGADGYYLFENLYVKDRILCELLSVANPFQQKRPDLFDCCSADAVPHPMDPPLPPNERIITSKLNENIISQSTNHSQLVSLANASLYDEANDFNYPEIPRLYILTPDEANEMTNGLFGRMSDYCLSDGAQWTGKRKSMWWNRWWNRLMLSRKKKIRVLEGLTFYHADDLSITFLSGLLNHY